MSESDKLLPCPFCGGDAEIIHIDEAENAGGSCVSCTRCLASSNVEFGLKENFVSNWNMRARTEDARLAAGDLLQALKGAIGALEFSRDYHETLATKNKRFARTSSMQYSPPSPSSKARP